VTDLLLRRAQASRAGAQGDDDYDVFGTDGIVIGRIFKATTSPVGTPWIWTLAYGDHEDRTPMHGYEATLEAAMHSFARSWHREDVTDDASALTPSLSPKSVSAPTDGG
jgi:hypothetical protein